MAHTHRFCVIAGARSGSEYFTTRLNEHPEIACHRELFNRRRFVTALDEERVAKLPSLASRDADPIAAIDAVAALSADAFPGKRYFGFKVFLSHNQEIRKHVREDLRYKLIVLERKNKLAQYASLLTSRRTGVWSVWAADAQRPGRETVKVDIPGLEHYVRLENQRYSEFGRRIAQRPDVLRMTSEELDSRFQEILEFLEVDASTQLPVVRLRQNPDPLAERVENWTKVLNWLNANGHEDWATG